MFFFLWEGGGGGGGWGEGVLCSPGRATPVPLSACYCCRLVAQGASKMRVVVKLGNIKLEFKAQSNRKGIVEWYQGEEAHMLELPADPAQIPDILVYLVRREYLNAYASVSVPLSDSVRVCVSFSRYGALDRGRLHRCCTYLSRFFSVHMLAFSLPVFRLHGCVLFLSFSACVSLCLVSSLFKLAYGTHLIRRFDTFDSPMRYI